METEQWLRHLEGVAEDYPLNTLDRWDAIIARARDIVEHKDADYGASWRVMRVTSLLDRMRTKLDRADQLLTQPGHAGKVAESVQDSLLDIVNEAVFALLQFEAWGALRPHVADEATAAEWDAARPAAPDAAVSMADFGFSDGAYTTMEAPDAH